MGWIRDAIFRWTCSGQARGGRAPRAEERGGIYTTRTLSEEYGFNDIDGSRPDYAVLDAAVETAKQTYLAPLVDAGRFTNVDWKLAPKTEPLRESGTTDEMPG